MPGDRSAGRSLWLRIRRNGGLYLLMIPAMIIFICFTYLPMYGIVIAFKRGARQADLDLQRRVGCGPVFRRHQGGVAGRADIDQRCQPALPRRTRRRIVDRVSFARQAG